MLRRKKPTEKLVPKNIFVDENVGPKPKPVPIQQEAEYEGKFKAIIKPLGSYKVQSDLTQQSMPFFKIWVTIILFYIDFSLFIIQSQGHFMIIDFVIFLLSFIVKPTHLPMKPQLLVVNAMMKMKRMKRRFAKPIGS